MVRHHPLKIRKLHRVFFFVLWDPVYDTQASKTFNYLKDRNYRHPLKRLSSVISLRSPEIVWRWLCDWTRRFSTEECTKPGQFIGEKVFHGKEALV
jgi:hypothetical protein